jgi:hypothetical protein
LPIWGLSVARSQSIKDIFQEKIIKSDHEMERLRPRLHKLCVILKEHCGEATTSKYLVLENGRKPTILYIVLKNRRTKILILHVSKRDKE